MAWTKTIKTVSASNIEYCDITDDGVTIWILLNGGGMIKSTDGGTSFNPVGSYPGGGFLRRLKCDGFGQYVITTQWGGAPYVTGDGGVTWTPHATQSGTVECGISDDGRTMIYYSSDSSIKDIKLSTNYGLSFTNSNIGTSNRRSMKKPGLSENGQHILIPKNYTDGAGIVSNNNGGVWFNPVMGGKALQCDVSSNGSVMVATYATIGSYISVNHGATWNTFTTDDIASVALGVDPSKMVRINNTTSAIEYSEDTGNNWSTIDTFTGTYPVETIPIQATRDMLKVIVFDKDNPTDLWIYSNEPGGESILKPDKRTTHFG